MSPDEFIERFELEYKAADGLVGVVDVILSPGREVVSFDTIKTLNPAERRQGHGARALKLLLDLADECGMPLELIPRQLEGDMSDEALAGWYRENGFKAAPTDETPNLMRRDPKKHC